MPTTPATTFDEVQAVVADVEGWMTPGQARRLWTCARTVRPGRTIVEIGSFRGRSMIVLASAAEAGVDLVAIDPHAGNDRGPHEFEGFEEQAADDHDVFIANLEAAGIRDKVRHVRKFSHDALVDVEGEIDLLYIDGAHRFTPALDDIRRWSAKVRPGGDLLIHDSFSSVGVTGAIAVSLLASSDWRYLGRSESMTHYRKESLTSRERVRNIGRQLASLPYFVRNLLIKALILAKLGSLTQPLFGHDPATWPH
ncbi:class I SAM-dependent methyltransferase [Aquihabitans sp. McL0605]|uniref:class I SAM-dependent methyltransferase n=1 Tax=Aquihabitans sp. McL0605 TaxID=3415671 RepID=UPI003CF17E6B